MASSTSHTAVDTRAAPTTRSRPTRVGRGGGGLRNWQLGLAGVVSLVVVWHTLVAAGIVAEQTVPYPLAVGRRLGSFVTDGAFLGSIVATLAAWATAMGVAILIAVPVGLGLGHVDVMYRSTSTVIHTARSIPSSALIPISILFFGLGTQMKASLAVYAIFWPLLLHAMYGVRAADRTLMLTARSLRWNRRQLVARLILPSALPSIATGIRLASSIALVVVLSAELLGATSGVGTVITRYAQARSTDAVYAGILVIGGLGVLISQLLQQLEYRIVFWVPRRDGKADS